MSSYNFRKDDDESRKARSYLEKLIKKGSRIKIEETNTRTAKQNSALHLFYTFIANELNESGATHNYESALTGNVFEIPFTTTIIKEHYWKPIQWEMFKIKSTTKLDTQKMNDIIDVLILAMANRGLVVSFPDIKTLMDKNNN